MKPKYWLISAIAVFCCATSSLLIASFHYQAIANIPVAPKIHPLPPLLAQLPDNDQGDYFELIENTPAGYLVWSQFPIAIYIEPLSETASDPHHSAAQIRTQQWLQALQTAISEWQQYFPLELTESVNSADITILRSPVEREIKLDPQTGLYDIPRAITAQTSYQFYLSQPEQTLSHKMTLQISPELSPRATLSAARHELGHALGIWGHSDRETDALYFSQVRDTPTISLRDLNTLKKIYQQPTKLGWQVD